MTTKAGVYGQVVVGEIGAVSTQHADEITGFRVGRHGDAPVGLDIQYKSGGEVRSLTVPLPQAVWLLSMLKSFQLNENLPFPDDPRNPDWKASDYKSRS